VAKRLPPPLNAEEEAFQKVMRAVGPAAAALRPAVDSSNAEVLKGFYEKEVHRVTQRFGNIAHVFSTYESRLKIDGPVIARGINSIEAFWDGQRWWIASAIWDEERPDNPLPAEYLANPK